MRLREIAKDAIRCLRYGSKGTEARYIQYLRKSGVRVGRDVHLYSPWTIEIDVQRPWMISIGDNVHITAYCSILQHDYSWSVIQRKTGHVYGSCGEVSIGNNVFIGQKAIILKNTIIQDNVIIGAGSVVSGTLEANSVYAGVPARRIMSLESFEAKRAGLQLEEAALLVQRYRALYGETPPRELLREFFWLFESRGNELPAAFSEVLALNGSESLSKARFLATEPLFNDYEDFLTYVLGDKTQPTM